MSAKGPSALEVETEEGLKTKGWRILYAINLKRSKETSIRALAKIKQSNISKYAKRKLIENKISVRKKRRITAALLVLSSVVCLLLMSYSVKEMLREYKSPYFFITFVHSWWFIALIPWWIWKESLRKKIHNVTDEVVLEKDEMRKNLAEGLILKIDASVEYLKATDCYSVDHIRYGMLGYLSLIGGYTWYLSLPLTHIGPNTCVAQSFCVFVYLFSICILKEKPRLYKSCAVVLCLIGIAGIVYGSSEEEVHEPVPEGSTPLEELSAFQHFMGYTFVSISCITFAFFEVVYKLCTYPYELKRSGDILEYVQYKHPHINAEGYRAIGIMGVASFTGLVFVPILHYTGFEEFEVPSVQQALIFTYIGVIDMVYNLVIILAVGLVGPVPVSLGMLLSMPASMVMDAMGGVDMTPLALIGACLILTGFVLYVKGGECCKKKKTRIEDALDINDEVIDAFNFDEESNPDSDDSFESAASLIIDEDVYLELKNQSS